MNQDTELEVVKLLSLVAKRGLSQTEYILELNSLRFTPKRIAELSGTTSGVVSQTIYSAKKRKRKK